MGNQMAEAYNAATTGGTQKQRQTAAPTKAAAKPPKKKVGDAVAAARKALEALRRARSVGAKASEADAAAQEEAIEQVAELRQDDDHLTAELDALNRERGRNQRGSHRAEDGPKSGEFL